MTHNDEVKELYEKLTIKLSPDLTGDNIKGISLEAFTLAIDTMMLKARWHGLHEGMQEATSIVDRVLITGPR